jgi:hypothetical protein
LGITLSPLEEPFKTWLLGRGGEMAGKWRQEIPPSFHRNHHRHDEIRVRHRRSGRLSAAVTRLVPSEEEGRKWRMAGFLSGHEIVLVFWPTGRVHDGTSFGVMVLHRDPDSRGARWHGRYVRPGTEVNQPPG